MKRSWDAETIGSHLNWKQFEELAEQAFRSFGFETTRNLRFRKPTMEIDLLARSRNIAFAVDCKHWKRTVGNATMTRIASLQTKRSERVFEFCECDRVMPVILTLHDEMLHFLESGVAVVPIQKISDFVLNWESYRDSICVLEPRGERQTKLAV